MANFDEIRPYRDAEVKEILASVINDPEFLSSIIQFKYPSLAKPIHKVLRFLLKIFLGFKTRNIETVRAFQLQIESYIEHMLEQSTTEFTLSGLQDLDLSKPCLFVSNHRDIVLDPAFVNWSLHKIGQDTVRIAIGDNLLSKPWISALMRLNKSFIVKRGLKSPRDKLKASKQLSAYIAHSLNEEGEHVWIAHREGRAKDGKDITNSALLSMLALNKAKADSFGGYIKTLNLVPVSISYEYDPCDLMKAQELQALDADGEYQKEDHEDAKSISMGITKNKGRVHLHFGQPVSEDFEDAKSLAEALDQKILDGYRFHVSALHAADLLGLQADWSLLIDVNDQEKAKEMSEFEARIDSYPENLRTRVLEMYANPHIALKNGLWPRT